MILETSREMRLKPLANKQVMKTQPLCMNKVHIGKNKSLVSSTSTNIDLKSIFSFPMVCAKVLDTAL